MSPQGQPSESDSASAVARHPVACTLVTRGELPAATVLAESYLRHHPGHDFVITVLDDTRQPVAGADYRVVGVDRLGIERSDFLRMATCYPPAELAEALLPSVLIRLLADHDVALYLHHQGEVFAPLPEVAQLAAAHDIALTPRLLAPAVTSHDEADADDGVFDLGLLAVGAGAKPFLDYWAERVDGASPSPAGGERSVAQLCLDRVPALFRHHILRDPGLNVGHWNVHERALAEGPGAAFTADGEPLKYANLSGYHASTPWLSHADARPGARLSEHAALRTLCDGYRERLLAAGHQEAPVRAYRYATLPDGTALTLPMRRLFHSAWRAARRPDDERTLLARELPDPPPHPFGDDGARAFIDWIRSTDSPLERAAGLNRLTSWVWRSRVDLQVAYPAPSGESAPEFRHWCRTHGVTEGVLPHWALPVEPAPPAPPVDVLGVNVIGFLTAELGIGQMGRIVLDVAERTGLPVSSVTDEHSVRCRTALEEPDTADTPRYPISILAANADYMGALLGGYPEAGHKRYRIGLWAWELEDFPESLHEGFRHVDEVWTVSDFTREAIAKHSPVPVKTFPVPVHDPGLPARPARRPGDPVTFFYAFDFNSTGGRKNPYGLVEAFRRAFGERADVRLVIKTTNSALHPAAAERLRYAIGTDPRVELMDRYLTSAELDALYSGCDAYVSLHRSEGFGLTVAEAMARALPVIATDYSSTTEFFDDTLGWTVPYRLVPVGPGWAPYQPDGQWADPDLDAAARAMREVAGHPEEAARRGAAARQRILSTRSVRAAADWTRAQLEEAFRMWQANRDAAPPERPSTPLEQARAVVRSRADPHSEARNPLAPAMRRAVLRAIDHYDVHQREVLGALIDAMHESVERLTAHAEQHRSDSAEARATVDARLAALTARLEALERQRELGEPPT